MVGYGYAYTSHSAQAAGVQAPTSILKAVGGAGSQTKTTATTTTSVIKK